MAIEDTPIEEFVERSVAHQLGGVTGPGVCQDQDAREWAEAAASGGAMSWDNAAAMPRALNGWERDLSANATSGFVQPGGQATVEKYARTLEQILHAGCDFDLIVDMQDRRSRNLRLPDGRVFPTISFNRLNDVTDRVLWPLPLFHDIENEGFLGGLDPAAVAWADKDDKIVWRGIPGGRASPHGDVRRETVRLFYVLKRHAAGEMST